MKMLTDEQRAEREYLRDFRWAVYRYAQELPLTNKQKNILVKENILKKETQDEEDD
jgi:hypothetical protein